MRTSIKTTFPIGPPSSTQHISYYSYFYHSKENSILTLFLHSESNTHNSLHSHNQLRKHKNYRLQNMLNYVEFKNNTLKVQSSYFFSLLGVIFISKKKTAGGFCSVWSCLVYSGDFYSNANNLLSDQNDD